MLSIPVALNSLVSVPLITEGLQEYFKAFGEVTDCIVMHDPVSKRSRYWHFELKDRAFSTLYMMMLMICTRTDTDM